MRSVDTNKFISLHSPALQWTKDMQHSGVELGVLDERVLRKDASFNSLHAPSLQWTKGEQNSGVELDILDERVLRKDTSVQA